jgi:hypothetical protein
MLQPTPFEQANSINNSGTRSEIIPTPLGLCQPCFDRIYLLIVEHAGQHQQIVASLLQEIDDEIAIL